MLQVEIIEFKGEQQEEQRVHRSVKKILPPLHLAALEDNIVEINRLLAAGADIDEPFLDKWTPLHFALTSKNGEAAQTLLKAGANPNAVTKTSKYTPLHFAAVDENVPMINALIGAGAKIDKHDNRCLGTPLRAAVIKGKVEAVKALLAGGATINKKTGSAHSSNTDLSHLVEPPVTESVLSLAVRKNRVAIADVLIAAGANINHPFVVAREKNIKL